MKGLVRFYRTLRGRNTSFKTTAPKTIPELSVGAIRDQLSSLSPEDRTYLQNVLSTRENEISQQLQKSEYDSDEQKSDLVADIYARLDNAQSMADFDMVFWQSARELAKNKKEKHVDLFARLFEVAKRIPNQDERDKIIYFVGTYLYRLKTIRFDPVNEVEYLDSLVRKSRVFLALKYWNSRKDRPEVSGSIYWSEIGALYYLDAGLNSYAERIAQEMLKNGYVPPRLIVQLIQAYSRRDHTSERLKFWTNELVKSISNHGVIEESQEIIESIDDALNRKTTMTAKELGVALGHLIASYNWDLAAQVLKAGSSYSDAEAVLQKLCATIRYGQRKTEPSMNNFVTELIEQSPEAVSSPSLYFAWIASLVRLGDPKEAQTILDTMAEKQIPADAKGLSRLAMVLLKNGEFDLAQHMNELYDIPELAVVFIRYLSKHSKDLIPSYVESINCDLTPELAHELLKNGNPTSFGLLDLGLDHKSWRLIWSSLRHSGVPNAREAFERMIECDNFKLSLNMLESILQTFIMQRDLVGATAVLYYQKERYNKDVNKILFSGIIQLTDSLRDGRNVTLSDVNVDVDLIDDPKAQGETIHWTAAAKLLERDAVFKVLATDAKPLGDSWLAKSTK